MPRIDAAAEPPIQPIALTPIGAQGWQSVRFVPGHDCQSLVNTDTLARVYTWAHQHAETCTDDSCSMNSPRRAITGICSALLSLPPDPGRTTDEDANGAPIAQVMALLDLRSRRAGYLGVVDHQTVAHALGIIGRRGRTNSQACAITWEDLRRLEVLVMLETVFGPMRSGPIREDIKRRAHHVLNDTDQPIEVRAAAMRAVCRMHFERSVWTTDLAEARRVIGHHPTFGRYARAYDGAAIRAHPDVLAAFRAVYPLEPSPLMPAGESYWSVDVA